MFRPIQASAGFIPSDLKLERSVGGGGETETKGDGPLEQRRWEQMTLIEKEHEHPKKKDVLEQKH